MLRDSDDLIETLSAGLGAAVRGAFAAAGVERPFVVEHRMSNPIATQGRVLPGLVHIGSERFRDQVRTFSSIDGEAVRILWKGEASGDVARIALEDHCDAETLRACREVNSALSVDRDYDDSDQQRARAALNAVGDRLAEELNRPGLFDATADPFLVLIEVGDPWGPDDWQTRALRTIGSDRVERFLASVASVADADGAAADVDPVAASHDRDALERWLRARRLDRAHVIAHEEALTGFRLSPTTDGRSRIGGPGLLPLGAEWPRTSEGRPLSFLAGIDLSELPATGVLPDAGWLLFFADLNDEGEALGFIGEPTPNDEGAAARMLWVDARTRPVDAEPPPDLPRDPYVRLPERRVTPRPQLTLEDGRDSARALGLDAVQAEAYDEIANALRLVPGSPDDWVLGAVTGVQGHQPEPDSVLLLHLASIEWLDGGAIQFRIREAELADRNWSQAWAEGDSC